MIKGISHKRIAGTPKAAIKQKSANPKGVNIINVWEAI